MRISDWSSDVCSSDLRPHRAGGRATLMVPRPARRDRGRQPFTDRYQSLAIAHERPGLPIRPGDPRNKEEHHAGVARTRCMFGARADDIEYFAGPAGGRRWQKVLRKHGPKKIQRRPPRTPNITTQ